MRKFLTRVITFLLAVATSALTPAMAIATPGDYQCELSGTGELGDPYRVGSKADLLELPDCDDQVTPKIFLQTADIDLGPGDWTPINQLSGWYSGADHTISNLQVSQSSNNAGLFANSGRNASVNSLTLKVKSVSGVDQVGSLFGSFQGAFLSDITVIPQDSSHEIAATASSYSVSSNTVIIQIGSGHNVKVGAQISINQFGLGPLPARTSHRITAVDSGAGTISLSYATPNQSSQALSPVQTLEITNPIISGRDGVGGLVGRGYGYYASAINPSVHANAAVYATRINVSLSVSGVAGVGGIAGTVERIKFAETEFHGQVSGDESVGGFAGRSYDARWQLSSATGSVTITSDRAGGLMGMIDDSGEKPYCAVGTPTKFLSVSSPNSNELQFVYPELTYLNFNVGSTVALKVFAMFNAPASIRNGAIGTVTGISTNGSNQVVVNIAATTTTFTSENYYPTDFVFPISSSTGDCGSGIYHSDFAGTVTAGSDGSGYAFAGGIAGMATRSKLKDVDVEANVFAQEDMVGGVIGSSQLTDLQDLTFGLASLSHDSSSVQGGDRVGGIAGTSSGYSRGSYLDPEYQIQGSGLATLNSPINGLNFVGGLFGQVSNFSFRDSGAEASVQGLSDVGGLVGQAGYSSTITNVTYDGSWVFGSAGYVGGIAGRIQGAESAMDISAAQRMSAALTRLSTTAPHLLVSGDQVWIKFVSEGISKIVSVLDVIDARTFLVELTTDGTYSIASGDEFVEVNGVVEGFVTREYPVGAAGSIRADASYVGGLVGSLSDGVISDSSNSLQLRIGAGSGNTVEHVGGLVGDAYFNTPSTAFVRNSHSTANIYADSDFDTIQSVGGLVGSSTGYQIQKSNFQGTINIPRDVAGATLSAIGGVVGTANQSQVISSFAHGVISADFGSKIGGLIGYQWSNSIDTGVIGSFFDGEIDVPAGTKIGGLVGTGNQDITYSHATAVITGDEKVGGLMGEPYSNPDLTFSFFDGEVARTDTDTTTEVIGDTVNTIYAGNASTAFWNSTTQDSTLTVGAKTAEELSTASTFASWTNFADYFVLPTSSQTANPFPTLLALMFAPGALEVLSPATDLNGSTVGTQIVPITTAVWAYPRPVLDSNVTLPTGLTIEGLSVSGTPSSAGAYSFALAAKNSMGVGPSTWFTGSIQGGAGSGGTSYSGPLVSGFLPNPAIVGKSAKLIGSNLQLVSKLEIGGIKVTPTSVREEELEFIVPALTEGTYDLVLTSSTGTVTVQDGIRVISEKPNNLSVRRKSSGTVKVYHFTPLLAGKVQFFLNGNEVAWFDSRQPKTSTVAQSYFVRTLKLQPGKNVIEVFIQGKRVKRVIYSR